MPAPKLQPFEAAREQIVDMIEAMSSPDGFGFSSKALDHETIKLLCAERSENGKTSKVVVEMQVQAEQCNQLSNLHGGCAATILDNLSSLGIYLHTSGVFGEPWSMLGVSQAINIQYLAPVPMGSWIDVETRVLSIGKNVTLIACEIWRKEGQGRDAKRTVLTSTGTHTKIDNSHLAKL